MNFRDKRNTRHKHQKDVIKKQKKVQLQEEQKKEEA
jgi:hypothetical protein